MRHALEDRVKPCLPQILLAAGIGAMLTRSAQSMKRALIITAFVAKPGNA